MKFLPPMLCLLVAFCPQALTQTAPAAAGAGAPASGAPEVPGKEAAAKPRSLVTIDGEIIKGLVRVADSYNLSILTDNGIISLPIAKLSEKDMKGYDKGNDRSKDGKFWSERKSAYDKSSKKDPDITDPVAYFAQYQSLISFYDSSKESGKTASKEDDKPETPGKPLFSAPNSVEVPSGLDAMFGPGSGTAASAAGSAAATSSEILSSGAAAVGGAAGIPTTVPGMPAGK